jgi:hypothetical protein
LVPRSGRSSRYAVFWTAAECSAARHAGQRRWGIVAEDTDVSVSRREIITVRGKSYVSRLAKH